MINYTIAETFHGETTAKFEGNKMRVKDSQVSFNLSVGTPVGGKSPVWWEGEEDSPPLFWVENVNPSQCRATAYCKQYGAWISTGVASIGDIFEWDSPVISSWGIEVRPIDGHKKVVIPEGFEGILSEKFQQYIG